MWYLNFSIIDECILTSILSNNLFPSLIHTTECIPLDDMMVLKFIKRINNRKLVQSNKRAEPIVFERNGPIMTQSCNIGLIMVCKSLLIIPAKSHIAARLSRLV
jgi:hypothetical protein